jgi:hypothetical protein
LLYDSYATNPGDVAPVGASPKKCANDMVTATHGKTLALWLQTMIQKRR